MDTQNLSKVFDSADFPKAEDFIQAAAANEKSDEKENLEEVFLKILLYFKNII